MKDELEITIGEFLKIEKNFKIRLKKSIIMNRILFGIKNYIHTLWFFNNVRKHIICSKLAESNSLKLDALRYFIRDEILLRATSSFMVLFT